LNADDGNSSKHGKGRKQDAHPQASAGSEPKRSKADKEKKKKDKKDDSKKGDSKKCDKKHSDKKGDNSKKCGKNKTVVAQIPENKAELFKLVVRAGKGFLKQQEHSHAQLEIKESLNKGIQQCRLNIYWNRAAVGLHSKKDSCDFAYYRFPVFDVNYATQMAVVVKVGELLAARMDLRSVFFRPKKFYVSQHSGMHRSRPSKTNKRNKAQFLTLFPSIIKLKGEHSASKWFQFILA